MPSSAPVIDPERERVATYQRLHDHPWAHAGAIARHYASLAKAAEELHWLTERKKGAWPPDSHVYIDAAIAHLVVQIKQRHLTDFGLPLEWP